jgi:hypothetical protein
MKKLLVAIVCVLAVSVSFAQTKSNNSGPASIEPVTVTGTCVGTEEGTATNYQPANTLFVRVNGSSPQRYVLEGPGRILDTYGRVIHTPIKPGAHVRVVYTESGNSRVIDHVIVEG